MGNYTALRHGYVGDPAVYTIHRADNSLCSSAVSWAEVEPTIATDMRQAFRAYRKLVHPRHRPAIKRRKASRK